VAGRTGAERLPTAVMVFPAKMRWIGQGQFVTLRLPVGVLHLGMVVTAGTWRSGLHVDTVEDWLIQASEWQRGGWLCCMLGRAIHASAVVKIALLVPCFHRPSVFGVLTSQVQRGRGFC